MPVKYRVMVRRSVTKRLFKLPASVQSRYDALVDVLRDHGPTGPHDWPNYGKLRGTRARYHCHLNGNHGFVACWEYFKDVITIEIYYVGSHQDAPY